jgi:hypothetical protein
LNGYTNSGQAHIEQKAGRHNRLSGGYDYERERYVTLNGTYSAPSSTGSTRFRQRSSSFYAQDLISLADSRLQISVGGRAQSSISRIRSLRASIAMRGLDADSSTNGIHCGWSNFLLHSVFRTKLRAHAGAAIVRLRVMNGSVATAVYYEIPLLRRSAPRAMDGGIDQNLFGSRVTISGTAFYTRLQESIIFRILWVARLDRSDGPSAPVGPFDPYGCLDIRTAVVSMARFRSQRAYVAHIANEYRVIVHLSEFRF